MKSSKFSVALILLVPIGLVAGPVLWAGLRSEIAHWYLAAGANALELGIGDVDKALESARAWDPEVGAEQDYLSVRLRQLKNDSAATLSDVVKEVPEGKKAKTAELLARQFEEGGDFALAAEVMRVLLGEKVNENITYWRVLISQALVEEDEAKGFEILREAIEANPNNPQVRTRLGALYATTLAMREDFALTLEAYKLWYGDKYDRDINTLNSLAYARALAKVELDLALTDINEALGYRPEDPNLRDTRAWVYFQLGRYDEALLDADFSVKALELPSLSNWINRQMEELQSSAEISKPESPPSEVRVEQAEVEAMGDSQAPVVMLDPPKIYKKRANTSSWTWTLAVMKYHRARILEAMGRSEEANADWEWIETNDLPPDDRLH